MLKRFATLLCASALAVACSQTDAGLTTKVKAQFAAADTVKAYQIDVDTDNGVVTLSGNVETSAAKTQAVQIARTTEGVRDVVDHLNVEITAPTSGVLEDFGNTADDLADDAREGAGRVGDAAREGADRAGAALTDAAVTSTVKAKLLADDMVRGLNIDVDTNNGTVMLNGTVSSRAEANQAVRLARGTDGVTKVVDNLKVASR